MVTTIQKLKPRVVDEQFRFDGVSRPEKPIIRGASKNIFGGSAKVEYVCNNCIEHGVKRSECTFPNVFWLDAHKKKCKYTEICMYEENYGKIR